MKYKILSGFIEVEGVRNYFESIKNCEASIIDANFIISIDNVKFAAEKAIKSWREGKNIAKILPMEILLYAAATRQIKDALKIGIKEGKNTVYVVLLNCYELPGFKKNNFEKIDPNENQIEKIKEFYSISDKELEIVGIEKIDLLIRERIALFDISK